MPLAPHLAALIASIADDSARPFHQMSATEARAAFEGFAPMAGEAPALSTTDVAIPVRAGKMTVRVIAPPGPPRATLLFLHGGGWVVGSVEGYGRVARQLAAATGATVVVPAYRLAPEHPFPTPLQDCLAAAIWARTQSDLQLITIGDSAGGNLAAALALMLRDSGAVDLAGQVLIYPVTDCDPTRDSYVDPANHVLLAPRDMAWFWDQYVPDPLMRRDPLASPLRAAVLSRLPPALIVTAEYDILRDEGEAYARRLSEAGTVVQSERIAGQAHGFFVLGGTQPESAAVMGTIVRFLDRIL